MHRLPFVLEEEAVRVVIVAGLGEGLPGGGNILRKGHAEPRMRGGAAQEWKPEDRRRVVKERGQVREDDASREEQVPLRIVGNVIEIGSHLERVFSQIEAEAVR